MLSDQRFARFFILCYTKLTCECTQTLTWVLVGTFTFSKSLFLPSNKRASVHPQRNSFCRTDLIRKKARVHSDVAPGLYHSREQPQTSTTQMKIALKPIDRISVSRSSVPSGALCNWWENIGKKKNIIVNATNDADEKTRRTNSVTHTYCKKKLYCLSESWI